MAFLQRIGLAEGGHVGAKIIEPDFLGIAFIALSTREEQHIRLNALCIKNASRQTQNGMQITLLHQVLTNALTIAIGKKYVIREHDRSAGITGSIQAAIDMLEKVQLLIAG